MANVGQTSFWHFCHDRNCNNQPQQHKRHNHKVVIICSPVTKNYFRKTVRCRIHYNSLNFLNCAAFELLGVFFFNFLYAHYYFAGKVFFGQNNKNSCVLAVSSIYLLKDWGLAHQEKDSGPLKFYLLHLKLWLAPFLSPCTNAHLKLDFNDGMKLFHHQTVQRTALKPARATLENHCNQWLPDLKTKTFPYSPFLSSCTLVSKGDMSLSCDIFMSHLNGQNHCWLLLLKFGKAIGKLCQWLSCKKTFIGVDDVPVLVKQLKNNQNQWRHENKSYHAVALKKITSFDKSPQEWNFTLPICTGTGLTCGL